MLIHSINELPPLKTFHYIYISIGSKYNEDFVYYPPHFHIAKKLPYQFLNKPSKAIENLCYRVDKDNNVLLRNDSLISFVTNKLLIYKFTSVGDFFVAINDNIAGFNANTDAIIKVTSFIGTTLSLNNFTTI